MKEIVGSQDQVAASYGGFNSIKFKKNGSFLVQPIKLKKNIKDKSKQDKQKQVDDKKKEKNSRKI